jgi:hypothetical protein
MPMTSTAHGWSSKKAGLEKKKSFKLWKFFLSGFRVETSFARNGRDEETSLLASCE